MPQHDLCKRPSLMLKSISFAAAMMALIASTVAARAADVTGVPKIQTADQISINNIRIKLAGIDAPALQQLCLDAKGAPWKCGIAAHDALASFVGTKPWSCHLMRLDRRARTLARCTVDGEDIHRWLVSNGWALAFRGARTYDADQKQAQAAHAGLWQGAFFAPADWRVRKKHAAILGAAKPKENVRRLLLASASGPLPPSPACRIKGNVNRSGQCIYHRPTSRWYAQIRMKVSKGTRWFCSVEDAEAAGCRETRR
jgi:endonuclease YncB( thermonuclease family)